MTTLTAACINAITPQFTIPDVVATAEHYQDVWGFTISGYWMDPPAFAIIEREGFRIFFNKPRPEQNRVPAGFQAATTPISMCVGSVRA